MTKEDEKEQQYLMGSMIALHRPISFMGMHILGIKNAGDNFLVNKDKKPVTNKDVDNMMNWLIDND